MRGFFACSSLTKLRYQDTLSASVRSTSSSLLLFRPGHDKSRVNEVQINRAPAEEMSCIISLRLNGSLLCQGRSFICGVFCNKCSNTTRKGLPLLSWQLVKNSPEGTVSAKKRHKVRASYLESYCFSGVLFFICGSECKVKTRYLVGNPCFAVIYCATSGARC